MRRNNTHVQRQKIIRQHKATPPSSIRTAGKSVMTAYGSGRVNLNVLSWGTTSQVVLSNVLYTPGLRNNLISVSAIINHGYSVTFGKEYADVSRRDGSTVLTTARKNRMYVVRTIPLQSAIIANNSITKLKIWHERYGHLNFNDLRKLKTDNMVTGLDIPTKMTEIPCKICNRAKMRYLIGLQRRGRRTRWNWSIRTFVDRWTLHQWEEQGILWRLLTTGHDTLMWSCWKRRMMFSSHLRTT